MERNSNLCGSGCKSSEKAKKRAFLTLYRDELLYDVKNVAYVIGDVHPEEDSHVAHQIQDVGEEGNIDRVTRMMDLAFAKCCNELYAHVKKDFECGTERDDIGRERAYYRMEMLVPVDFAEPALTYLTRLVHEYIVDWVLFDWFSIAAPDKAESWGLKAGVMLDEMKSALTGRLGRTRKTLTPF